MAIPRILRVWLGIQDIGRYIRESSNKNPILFESHRITAHWHLSIQDKTRPDQNNRGRPKMFMIRETPKKKTIHIHA